MKSNKVKEFCDNAVEFEKKNSPAILTGMAVVGLFTTAFTSYKAGLKAHDILEDHREDMRLCRKNDKEAKRAVRWETTKKMAPVLAPPIISAAVTTGCILGSNQISSKRVAVLSTAYAMSEKALTEWRGKTEELIGEKKTQKIRDAINQDRIAEDAPGPGSKILMTGTGDVLCKDNWSGRYFRSNANVIGQAINSLSADCVQDMYVSLNEFYDYLDIPRVPQGDEFGWNVDDLVHGSLPIGYSALLTPDMQPCLCIDYNVMPRTDYRHLM